MFLCTTFTHFSLLLSSVFSFFLAGVAGDGVAGRPRRAGGAGRACLEGVAGRAGDGGARRAGRAGSSCLEGVVVGLGHFT